MSIKRFVMIGSVALAVLLGVVGAAGAGTYTTGFESPTFTLGTVDGQDGWHSAVPGDVPALPNGYDQAVVDNGVYGQNGGTAFGDQSLRMSNAYTNGEFFYQTYSAATADPAGETQTNHVFDGSFQFISTSASEQTGLDLSVSPDNGVGARMSYIELTDTAGGIQLTFYDVAADGTFRPVDLGIFDRNVVHTIRFLSDTVPGEANDIVRLYVDGIDQGNRLGLCFTTWEQYYRVTEGHNPGVIDSFEFRAGGTAVPALLGGGYLYDNVSTETRNTAPPAPTVCGVPEVGQITPTGTTCQQYRDGTATTLGQVQYTTTKGNVIGSVSPGVFFYYTKVPGDKDDVVAITETNNGTPSYTAIPVQQGQSFIYDASTCTKLKWTVTTGTDGSVTGKLPATGDFIIGTKYNPSVLKGLAPPVPATITYSFQTYLKGTLVDTGATIDLAPKK
jgi:hypothetical protein